MEITYEFLEKNNACTIGIEFVKKNIPNNTELNEFLEQLTDDHLDWQSWLITRLMNKEQCVQYSIYAAELVLPIFEKVYPSDLRPRLAIEAAKTYLKNPCSKTLQAARGAADCATSAADWASSAADWASSAAYHAATSAATRAADCVARAADCATSAADWASSAADWATSAAYHAATSAATRAAYHAGAGTSESIKRKKYKQIIKFGLNILLELQNYEYFFDYARQGKNENNI